MFIFLNLPYLSYMISTSTHFPVNDRISFLVSAQYLFIVYECQFLIHPSIDRLILYLGYLNIASTNTDVQVSLWCARLDS